MEVPHEALGKRFSHSLGSDSLPWTIGMRGC
jgi:hypothetical protein